MSLKCCFCVPSKIGYNIIGALCCITTLVGLVILFSELLWGWAMCICFGIPSTFWLISLIRPANINKKIFAYTFIVLTFLMWTGVAVIMGIVLNELVNQGSEWQVYVFPTLYWLAGVSLSVYLFICLISYVRD